MKKHGGNILNKLSSLFSDNDIHKITITPLFGGSGIYWGNLMFAWIYDNRLYLKGHLDYLAMFIRYKMKPLEFNIGVTVKLLQYYEVTDDLWKDKQKLLKITKMVINYSSQTYQHSLKEPRIKDLPNMTLSLERSLFKIGITNLPLFRQYGTFKSYFKLKQYNKNLSKNVLYILHSALIGTHVATLTNEQKSKLKKEYDKFIVSLRE